MVFAVIIKAMRRDDVIAQLKRTEPTLRGLGVAGLYLFGSHARDGAGPDSDVDVFVDPASDNAFGFVPFMEAYEALRSASTVRSNSAIPPVKGCLPTSAMMWNVKRCGYFDGCKQEPACAAATHS
jgi:predicted nucleotidyltransferase